jgi:hypothetical protein
MLYLAIKQKVRGTVGQTMQNMADYEGLHTFETIEDCRRFIDDKVGPCAVLMLFDDHGEHGPVLRRHREGEWTE